MHCRQHGRRTNLAQLCERARQLVICDRHDERHPRCQVGVLTSFCWHSQYGTTSQTRCVAWRRRTRAFIKALTTSSLIELIVSFGLFGSATSLVPKWAGDNIHQTPDFKRLAFENGSDAAEEDWQGWTPKEKDQSLRLHELCIKRCKHLPLDAFGDMVESSANTLRHLSIQDFVAPQAASAAPSHSVPITFMLQLRKTNQARQLKPSGVLKSLTRLTIETCSRHRGFSVSSQSAQCSKLSSWVTQT